MTQNSKVGMVHPALAHAAEQRAYDRFIDGLSCTESIVETSCGVLGIEAGPHVRMATGFRAGMAKSGCVCGALVGAVMAGGLVHGREDEAGSEADTLALSRRLHERFVGRFGTTCCRMLNGDDFDSPEHDVRCAGITGKTMRMLAEELEWIQDR
ncbi:MAG: C-GCAxxG-C-C family protein [Gemmatimonadaceae bacterium]|nr:C-GCAxxG-C-C family protein [Gemmatimonadaceae bacterium]